MLEAQEVPSLLGHAHLTAKKITTAELTTLSRPLAYVPTMGALHAGHQALISEAKKYSDNVLTSIFINPLQFDSTEDLVKYPKDEAKDFELASAAGSSYVWFPKYEELYPGTPEIISAGGMGKVFEGASRPGHFDGMLTVVKRYFDLVKPEFAIFGEKDWQQLSLIKKMVKEFAIPVNVISYPTVREESGLALSSRNQHLSATGKKSAAVIYHALSTASKLPTSHERISTMREILSSEKSFTLDYAQEIESAGFCVAPEGGDRLIVAGWIEGVRLIDNMAIDAEPQGGIA
jgi:pantoate--beta-alanine ligase